MAGFYVHIPFCRKACIYCNFHFTISLKNKTSLLEAIAKEIIFKKNYLTGEAISTIYFGGGTPSIIGTADLSRLIEIIYKNYSIVSAPEITLEANPDDLSLKKLNELKDIGINRLSIGIQSFNDEDLQYLGRIHTASQAENTILLAKEAGFDNLTIDLIYGIPGSDTRNSWYLNLGKISRLEIPHFSAYALTVEPKTILDLQIKKGLKLPVDEELLNQQFFQLTGFASKNNYEHYEISNFALEGYKSKHNSAYWDNKSYIGVGPSAHSFDLESRQWNIAVNAYYIRKINNSEEYFEKEILSEEEKFNEYLMLSLRTSKGADLRKIKEMIPEDNYENITAQIEKNIENQLMEKKGHIIKMTIKGMIFSDSIISDLFLI